MLIQLSQFTSHDLYILSQNCNIFSILPNMVFPCTSLMEPCSFSWVFRVFFTLLIFFLGSSLSLSWSLHPSLINSTAMHHHYTAISEFRLLNRRTLRECPNRSPYLQVNVSLSSNLSDEEYVNVTVNGALLPSEHDWVAMVSSSHSK